MRVTPHLLQAVLVPGPVGASGAAIVGFFAAALVFALAAPPLFWLALAGTAALGVVFLAYRHVVAFSTIWLLIAGMTLEMTVGDLLGPDAFLATIALVKAAELGLVILCVLRFGASLDWFNPTFAFLIMFVASALHGLHPGLTAIDSLRSLVGSVTPYAFSFSRLSLRWSKSIIVMTRWIPTLSVVAALPVALAGIRPLFVNSGGLRLGGLGHPAFLAGFCLTAIYACLIELYRDGRRREVLLLAVNAVLLVLTGARAPLAYGTAVTLLSLACVSSPRFPLRYRAFLLLVALTILPLLALVGPDLSVVRVFNLLQTDAINLSGRDLLWPSFEQAAAESQWFGWGVGAGNVIIAPDSQLALELQTTAAHNEYLRILVEGGQFGRFCLIALFVLWAWRHTAVLRRTDKVIMRLVFVAFACHALTDNVLISTSACVLFAFVSAVFARGALEAEGATVA